LASTSTYDAAGTLAYTVLSHMGGRELVRMPN